MSKKKNGPYKLKINRLDFLSSVKNPAQGEGGRVALLKQAPDGEHVEVQLTAQVCKTDNALGLVFGFAFASSLDGGETPHVDVQDDAIDADFLKEAVAFIENGGATDVNHDEMQDGRVVFAWPLLPEINQALGIDSKTVGLAVAVKPSPETYAKFASGELKGFSIGGFGTREPLAKAAPTPPVESTPQAPLTFSQRAVLTTAVMGHTHLVADVADVTAGTTTTDRAYVAGSSGAGETAHAHPWVRNDDGTVTIGEALGHTHDLVNIAKPTPSSSAAPAGGIATAKSVYTDAEWIEWLDKLAARGNGLGEMAEQLAKQAAFETATTNAERSWGAAWLAKYAEENKVAKAQASGEQITKAARVAFAKARTDFESYVAKHAKENGVSFEVASGMLGAAGDPKWDDLYMKVDEAREVMKAAPIQAATKAIDGEMSQLNDQIKQRVEAFGVQHNMNAAPGGEAHQRLHEISPDFRKLVDQRDALRDQRDVAKRRAEQQQYQAAYKSADVEAVAKDAANEAARRTAMTKSARLLEDHVNSIAKQRNEPYPVAFTWALAHDEDARDLYEDAEVERAAQRRRGA